MLTIFSCVSETRDDKTFWKTCTKNFQFMLERFYGKVKSDVNLQGIIVATTLICSYTTVYILSLDWHSMDIEKRGTLPQYYDQKKYYFYNTTCICSIISIFFLLCGIFHMFVSFCCKSKKGYSCCKKTSVHALHFPVISCISSTLLALSFHFQNILIAWTMAPFYAGRIALYYGVIIFVYFLSLKYAYTWPISKTTDENVKKDVKKKLYYFAIFLLVCATIIVTGLVATAAIFIVYVPLNNSIEQSAVGISTIYHGAVLLAGGLIAYNVGGHYFGGSFSMSAVLGSVMNNIDKNPFGPSDTEWRTLPHETRMNKLLTGLFKCEHFKEFCMHDFYKEMLYTGETVSRTPVNTFYQRISQKLSPCVNRKLKLHSMLKYPEGLKDQLASILSRAIIDSVRTHQWPVEDPQVPMYTAHLIHIYYALTTALMPTITAAFEEKPAKDLPTGHTITRAQEEKLMNEVVEISKNILTERPFNPTLSDAHKNNLKETLLGVLKQADPPSAPSRPSIIPRTAPQQHQLGVVSRLLPSDDEYDSTII